MEFPSSGASLETVRKKIDYFESISQMNQNGVERQLTGLYRLTGLPDLSELTKDLVIRFLESLPSAESEVGVRQMEAEVISMMGNLWGHKNPCGMMTSGGTESNIIALFVAKKMARARRGTVVMPATAHIYLVKALELLGLDPVVVPVEKDLTVSAEKMRNAIRKDTIAIVATVGTSPWGTIDPIEKIGKIAEERSVYFHVDGAWGGLICPWLKMAGYDIPKFDFKVNGVSSISADPHKTGYAIYPAGSIVFREKEMDDIARWRNTGGEFHEPIDKGLVGGRPGDSIAVTWALFNYLGKRGYVRLSKKCMQVTENFVEGVQAIDGLSVPVIPKINLANAMSLTLDMNLIKQRVKKKGWFFSDVPGPLLSPKNTIWLTLFPYHELIIPRFLKDLEEATVAVRRGSSS